MAFLMIILICYIVVALIRKTPIKNEWLPLISGGLGLTLSIIAFYAIPTIVPSDDIGITIAYGFFCGLAATGSNQVFKQAVKYIKNKYGIDISLPQIEEEETKEETNTIGFKTE